MAAGSDGCVELGRALSLGRWASEDADDFTDELEEEGEEEVAESGRGSLSDKETVSVIVYKC